MTRSLRLIAASAAGVAQRLAQMLSSLVTLPLALHALGVAGFGVWGAATSLLWLSGMLTLGLGSALVTLIPRSLKAGRPEQASGYVTAALYGGAALSALLLLGGAAIILASGAVMPSAPFLVAAVALVLNIPLSIGAEIWFAVQKGHVAAFWALAQTLLGLAGLVAGVWMGAGVTLLVAVFYAALLLANGGCLAHALRAYHGLRPLRRLPPAALRAVLSQGGLLSAVTIAASASVAFDNVMALAWLGPAASARMAVAMRVCITATGLLGAVTQPFWPGFADALAARDHAWVRRTLRQGGALVLALAAGGAGAIMLAGAPVLRWWLHQDLHMTPALLGAMAAWIVAMTCTNVPGALLHAALRLKPQIIVLAVAALAGFGLKYLAARALGVTGILLVSPLLWAMLVAPAYVWLALRVVRRL